MSHHSTANHTTTSPHITSLHTLRPHVPRPTLPLLPAREDGSPPSACSAVKTAPGQPEHRIPKSRAAQRFPSRQYHVMRMIISAGMFIKRWQSRTKYRIIAIASDHVSSCSCEIMRGIIRNLRNCET
jgi:hypothetical protein